MKLTFIALVLTVGSAIGQTVENQTVKAAKMGDGKYTPYVINYDEASGGYTYDGCCADVFEIAFSEYTTEHKKFEIKTAESSSQGTTYFPDEDAFPVTFVQGRYQGNAEMHALYKAIDRTETNRMVFLDEWVYVLKEWKSKDDYIIDDVLHQGEITGMKAIKEAFAAKGKMEKANHKETLQAYLDAGFAKQAEVLPQWNIDNAALIQERADNQIKVEAAINGKNAEYWNSEEGQRVLAKSRQPEVTLVNDTGSSLYLCYGSGAYSELEPGKSKTFSCSGGRVYRGTLRPNNSSQYDKTDNLILEGDGNNCGSVVNASSVIR